MLSFSNEPRFRLGGMTADPSSWKTLPRSTRILKRASKVFLDFMIRMRRAVNNPTSPKLRRLGIVVAAMIFIVGAIVSLRGRPEMLTGLESTIWIWVFALVPFTVLSNATQFWLTARIAGLRPPVFKVLTVTLLSTAANLLPVPGGSVVRIMALKKPGQNFRQPIALTAFVAIIWLSISSLVAAACLFLLRLNGLALIAVTLFTISGIFAKFAWPAGLSESRRWIAGLVLVQSFLVVVGGIRLWLCFHAIGEPINLQESLVLLFSSVVAALAGIAPGGFGLTEATAAGLAVLIGVAPDAAFIATALNRITGLMLIGPFAVLISLLPHTSRLADSHRQRK